MRVIRMQVDNFLKLRAIDITPSGSMIQVTGANGSGKSSTLRAIYAALAGASAAPSQPVRQGEESAVIKLDLGEIKVTRKFNASGTTSLIVEAPNGARFQNPQSMLNSLIANIAFDPLAFTRMAPKLQLETLRKLVKLDTDVDALDGLNQRDFETRTETNRKVKSLESQIAAVPPIASDLPATPIDEPRLMKEFQEASNTNIVIERERSSRVAAVASIKASRDRAKALESEINMLLNAAEIAERKLADLAPLQELIDLAQARVKVEEARKVNEAIKIRGQKDALTRELAHAVAEADSLTQAMSQRLKEKQEAIARAEMPVKGLGFSDSEVTFNGLPFSQSSQAEQLLVSTVLAMAVNPTIRVIRIQDGSLLDEHNMGILKKLAERGDYQLWCEVVSTNDPLAIHMEDGSVVENKPAAVEKVEV